MESFQIMIDKHKIKVRRLKKDLYRISFSDIDLGNISKAMIDGQAQWISTTNLKPYLVEQAGMLIDEHYSS